MSEETHSEKVTLKESFWLWVMRTNQVNGIKYIVRKRWEWGRLVVRFEWRSADNAMGRFGGGWDWELGFQVGKSLRSVIFNLLVAQLVVRLRTVEQMAREKELRDRKTSRS